MEQAPWKAFRVVEGETSRSHQLRVPAGSAVGDFCDQLVKRGLLPADLNMFDLEVFANSEEHAKGESSQPKDSLEKYGADAKDPIIVKVPQLLLRPLWLKRTVENLRDALVKKYGSTCLDGFDANELHVFNGDVELDGDSQIGSLGQTMKEALVVTVPAPRTRGREETEEEADDNPAKRHRTDIDMRWFWREEETVDPEQGGAMNCDHAMEQLRGYHKSNYNLAEGGLGGAQWAVPLVDNVFGIGKTRFGDEYIRRCRQLLAAHPDDSFLGTISKCHTIQIAFSRTDLLDAESEFSFSKADAAFLKHICRVFELKHSRLPRALSPKSLENCTSLYLILAYLTREVGPLLILIDEIGAAFDDDKLDDAGKRECLKKFCIHILKPIFSIHRLFFLFLSNATLADGSIKLKRVKLRLHH